MIRDVHIGYRTWIFLPIPDKGTRSRIRNTDGLVQDGKKRLKRDNTNILIKDFIEGVRTSDPALSARCELSTPRFCATASIAVIFADTAAAKNRKRFS